MILCHWPSFRAVEPDNLTELVVLKLATLGAPPLPTVNSAFNPWPDITEAFLISPPTPFIQTETAKLPLSK